MIEDDRAARAALALQERIGADPVDLLLVLGSGLDRVADRIEDPVEVPLAALPDMPSGTVPGHAGVLRAGRVGDLRVLAQRGRLHLYEGVSPAAVTRTVGVAAALGASTMLVTNAAGGLDPELEPGELMLIEDHLNLTGRSPLVGMRTAEGSPPFVDMAAAYDAELRGLAADAAAGLGLELARGVYAGLLGPSYETPAEVAMLRSFGATAVGMSTVLEVIRARGEGLRVLGISSITNVHGEGVATSHEEVLEVGARAAQDLARLVLAILPRL